MNLIYYYQDNQKIYLAALTNQQFLNLDNLERPYLVYLNKIFHPALFVQTDFGEKQIYASSFKIIKKVN